MSMALSISCNIMYTIYNRKKQTNFASYYAAMHAYMIRSCPLLLLIKLGDIRWVIKFYSDASVESQNVVSNCISNHIHTQMKMLNMVIPILMHFEQICLRLECCKHHKAAIYPTKCDVINYFKLFPTVYHMLYCQYILTLSNQSSGYKSKCIIKEISMIRIYAITHRRSTQCAVSKSHRTFTVTRHL